MNRYKETPIDELMDKYAELAKDPLVAAYIEASEELLDRRRLYPGKPEREFYKAACGYEYTIELPYDELLTSWEKAWIAHHSYSFRYTDADGHGYNACLSLCGYSRDEIEKMIDMRIEHLESEAVGE